MPLRHHRLALVSAAVAGLVIGCGVSGPTELPYPYEDAANDGPGPSSSSGGQGAAGPDSGATSGVSSGAGGSGGTSVSSGSGAGPSSGSGSGPTGGGNDDEVCQPDGADVCIDCVKAECCDEILACLDDEACACWIDCIVQTQGDVITCALQCGSPGPVIGDVFDCAELSCPDACQLL